MTTGPKLVEFTPARPNKDVIDRLERILAEVKAGQWQSFVGILINNETGNFTVEYSAIASRLAIVGALSFAQRAIMEPHDD